MTQVADSSEVHLPKKKSLLERFDLPLHHLDFEYVKKCRDVKELEKILKVLRSKEEGFYPELESCAESQLAALDSKNRLLRKGTKVMTKADLSKEEWNNITTDLLDWKGGVEKKNSKILESKSRPTNGELPNIRSSTKGFQNSKKMTGNKNENPQRINSLDYKSWDAFDAEEECKKMDLVEETKVELEKRENSSESKRKKNMSIEELAIKSLGTIDNLSQGEREVMAVKEKEIGNEFYRTNKIEESIKHYTRSIHLHSSVAGLNNRAAAYLRQCAFNKALVDLNQVLDVDPKNVKARFRRAQSFQHKNMFREALDDINEVLVKEPTHVIARHIADQLRDSVSKLPKKHRIKIKDKETGKSIIKTVTEKEMLNDYKDEKFVEVNEWGFPKIMCNCNGKHTNYPGIRHEDHIRYQHLSNPPTRTRTCLTRTTKKTVYRTPTNLQQNPSPLCPVDDAKPSVSGVKFEIFEVEKGSEEIKSDSIGSKEVADMSPTNDPDSCVVADTNYPGIMDEEDLIRYQHLSDPPTKKKLETAEKQPEVIPNNLRPNPLPLCPVVDARPSVSGVKLEIIEVEKCSEEIKSDSIGSKEVAFASPTSHPNPCVVADMRSSKTYSLPIDKNEKFQKTNTNDKIKDTTSNAEAISSSQLGLSVGNQIMPVDQVKEVKTDKNITIQENRLVNGSVDLKKEHASLGFEKRSGLKMSCDCQEHFASFQFKKEWNALVGPDSLQRKADLLKSICPRHLVQAFGNFWEKEMLVDVVKCLLHHFNQTEQQRVAEYVKALPRLDRFNIISMFLDKDEKSLIQELMKNCNADVDLNIISAFPS